MSAKNTIFTILLTIFPLFASANGSALDTLEVLMREQPQVQEKIYVHTDNSMYFVGDTLWYKAYVVRADDFHPTDMSKLLYVELLTPDGYLVERQHVVVSEKGYTCGQFVLEDSLYSGYYEIRAYTRWQLNFNVSYKDYTRDDRLKFYGKQAAKDFFRDFEGLYSRVVPVYQKPKENGNYIDRYMAKRPKQRVLKEHLYISATFYPEGGQLIQGKECNVAFEIKDNNGQNIDIQGTLSDGRTISTQHQGRGQFKVTPTSSSLTATFLWNNKTYNFHLPKAHATGITVAYDAPTRKITINSSGATPSAYAVLCRGKLIDFQRLNGTTTVDLSTLAIPTGISEIIVYDSEAHPLASRLFFVNNHDYGKPLDIQLVSGEETVGKTTDLKPYAPVTITVNAPLDADGNGLGHVSLAVRDAQTDDRGYDTGNIMTDMLLSSELKGFIANPAYYFESDDAKHVSDLDLLLQVQGWRRYKRVDKLRYTPEVTLTYEGRVMKIPENARILELEDLIASGAGDQAQTLADQMIAEAEALNSTSGKTFMESEEEEEEDTEEVETSIEEETIEEYTDDGSFLTDNGKLRKPVLVEAELIKDNDSAGAIARTDKNGRFVISLPPYYDRAFLFIKAYDVKDSLTKCMGTVKGSKGMMDERQFPDYLVRRDMFFPIYSQPYSWYQINSPEIVFVEEDDENIPENSLLSGNHTLQTVVVKARRRGKRGLDMTKPAIVRDAYEVYNDVTDYGLSLGILDFRRFPVSVATYFFGNMGRRNQFNIRAMTEGTTFYRNYTPNTSEYDKPATASALFQKLRLNRIKDIRLFSDYELRVDSGDVVETHSPDVTIDFVPVDNDAKRYTYRDRRYVFDGITYPEAFYSPNYSNAIPEEPKDYRRTLYWNPNAQLDADGTFQTTFYNNARETRVSVSAAGIDSQGQMYYTPLRGK